MSDNHTPSQAAVIEELREIRLLMAEVRDAIHAMLELLQNVEEKGE